MSRPTVLISGASIAGPTAASWMAAAGWDVTVVERFDHLRDEGQNVDVRGNGREVLRRMGLEDAVRAHHTSETGVACVDADGHPYATFPAGTDDVGGVTAELEILRGQLSRIVYDHSAGSAEYLFGDRITALHDDGRGVDVEFAHSPARRFDAVVIAEGSRSRTRTLVFPDTDIDELGLLAVYATIPRTPGDDRQWRVFWGGRGRLVHVRPDNVGSTRAMLSLQSDVRGLDRLDRADVVTVLRETYGDLGWETPRILAALDDAPLYVDQIARVRLPTWHRGRVALLGDAAWCAGPFGTGTTTALAGAYVLAGELGATPDDVPAAFARYESTIRPLADRAQARVLPRHAHPRARWQQSLLRAGLRIAAGPVGDALGRIPALDRTPPADAIALPDHGALTRAA
ncbi:2-polyprenyl-6-methoxyphenol hydroxylase-like FAD-dependent oxidoreductase [Pseudonocardia sediminis]|uniref:2-polyprenyl-6-methoxyphenol hydroxylase-like FAD-dependent oxidoreductase n=1 Tax=Pseudonocardia sediminis TaxID=1397368 RepID=A0A4Q7V0I0_PSEST|nr:FAD-dependent monooxygenase [Pseudonocardia sediminis]RZT86918.1 2-polyprenyl-6-methoxyphenol hydroxylase-like FAD-dependent oxidoreductase [Pseudonocardia sediminis]